MLQQSSLESQLFVGLGELSRSFRDPPIDFICDQIIHAALKAFDFQAGVAGMIDSLKDHVLVLQTAIQALDLLEGPSCEREISVKVV